MKILISVIVPVYNTAQYLPRCIESVLNQTLTNIELILVNDGSTDNSSEICNQYANKDKRVKVFHQRNQGMVSARRKGLLESRGKYITFVDSDDFVAHNSFAMAKESIKNNIDMIMFQKIKYYDAESQNIENNTFMEKVYNREAIEKYIYPRMIWDKRKNYFGIDPSLCDKIVKKKLAVLCYENIKDMKISLGEDVALTYPMIKNAETIEIKNQAYYYYQLRKRTEVPPYVADRQFFDKLYMLFKYLTEQFMGEPILLEQIEYYYMYFILWRKHLYGDYQKGTDFLFPFDRIEKGSKIVIYGAGVVGHSYMEQLRKLDFCEVVLWVDNNWREIESRGISAVEEIKSAVFDKVVIAIESKEICGNVKKTLLNLGVKLDCIIY
ncbi:hypothetical protein C818_02131 [Lachnospiraceae bacterium MD308]|nr:hypothetical protein C818_02131 [Lachnospiraceae bacterium MD308]